MIKKLTRWFLPILVAVLGVMSLIAPVVAAVAQPDDLEIQGVAAYENAREDGDQLYLITYYADFDLGVGESYEGSINELFIFRLLDAGSNEIPGGSTTAFPYYNQGYGLGVVAIYFEADEAPTWGSSLTVQLAGNPLVDWDGDPPSTATSSITWTTDAHEEIQRLVSAKVISLASQLEQAWFEEMVTAASGITILSDTGASYFLRVVPYLKDVAPYVLGTYTYPPNYPSDKPSDDTYANTLIDALDGTIFDLKGPARSFHTSPGALAATIYYPFVVAFFILLLGKHKLNKGTMFLAWPFVIAGTWIGVPLVVTILAAFIAGGSTFWVLYKGAP